MSSSSNSSNHLAAVIPSRTTAFVVQERSTPTPGPHEVLVEVKSIALNPIDYMQRARGYPSLRYPAIIGSDVAGTVIAVGSGVDTGVLAPGTRVTAFAPSFFKKGSPDYGAFQGRALIPEENVTPLPDSLAFNEASVLPMAVQTAWCGWMQIGLARDARYTPADKKGVLVWGASSSVGCAALQIAKLAGLTVYATASAKNHEYLKGLGAARVFDYADKNVVAKMIQAAKEDGIAVEMAYLASGDLSPCIDVLRGLRGDAVGKLALAPFKPAMLLWKIFPRWKSTELKFVTAPHDREECSAFFRFVFRTWLPAKLVSGEFIASPKVRVVPGGLQALEQAVYAFKKGVSAVKLVLEI